MMYSLFDYAYNGCLYLNNTLLPRRKRLAQLMIYATTACQSRCRHCNIWQKPVEHLPFADIRRIMQSRCVTRRTTVGLEGGEFVLHPEADAIMAWFRQYHPNYTLLSNCLAPRKVIEAVRRHHPRHLYLSLDGGRETYRRMRGCDGFDRVIQVVEAVKDEVPLSLMFCLSPWNTFRDMDFVIGLARRYGVDVRIGIYGTMAYMVSEAERTKSRESVVANPFLDGTAGPDALDIPPSLKSTQENFDFVALYDQWRSGHLRLPCKSILSSLVVHSNGDVPLCQNLDVVLGNIHRQSLDEIFNGPASSGMQCRYSRNCNDCWINFHRKYDIILLRSMERLMPKHLVEAFCGPYRWTEAPGMTYRQYFKNL